MAGTVNQVIIVGNLGVDPEVRRTNDGKPVARLRVATSDTWRDKQTGERRERTEWHTVVIFNEHLVKVAEQHVKKGMKIFVEGENRTRRWTDDKGVERYVTEISVPAFRGRLEIMDWGDERSEKGNPTEDGATSEYDSSYDDAIPF